MNIVVGGVPRGEDFFDRESLVAELLETLKTSSVMLLGPRRFGKTAVMHKLIDDQMKYPDLSMIYKNCQPMSGAEEFWTMIQTELGGWEKEDCLVIELDEFPSLLETILKKGDMEDVSIFLAKFRDIRQDPVRGRSLRFMIAGSTSVDIFLREVGFDLMGDMRRMEIGPFDSAAARRFLDICFKESNLKVTEDRNMIFDTITKLCGHVPYFMQIFISEIRLIARDGAYLTIADIYKVYWSKVLGGTGMQYFSYFHQRLDKYGIYGKRLPDNLRYILSTLAAVDQLGEREVKQLIRSNRVRTKSNELDIIMANLQDEFYLTFDTVGRKYRFTYTIMSDWWRRYHPPTDKAVVEEVYLIDKEDGILVSHGSRSPNIIGDADSTAGMLTGTFLLMDDLGYGIPHEIQTEKGTFLVVTGGRLMLAGMILGGSNDSIEKTFVSRIRDIEEMNIPDLGALPPESKRAIDRSLNEILGEY